MKDKVPIGILISGRGSNMSALLRACKQHDYPCKPVAVISNTPQAPGLGIAQSEGVPTHVIDHKEYSSREKFEQCLNQKLRDSGAHLLCNAGFMRILTENFTESWRDRHLNIHPSLLPAFPGIQVHERVLQSGVKFTGCTVHYVRAKPDAGPIISHAFTDVLNRDTVESLAARVLKQEHQLYVRALRVVAEENAPVYNEQVNISPQTEIEKCLILAKQLAEIYTFPDCEDIISAWIEFQSNPRLYLAFNEQITDSVTIQKNLESHTVVAEHLTKLRAMSDNLEKIYCGWSPRSLLKH